MARKKIGIIGGGSIYHCGTVTDMKIFLETIDYYLPSKYPDKDWSIINDRLYIRYLRLEELDTAKALMELAEKEFKQLGRDAVNWSPKVKRDLDITKATLYDIFNIFFSAFYACIESAKLEYETINHYRPVMVAVTTKPHIIAYEKIPLSVFDNLPWYFIPFWMSGQIPKKSYKNYHDPWAKDLYNGIVKFFSSL